MKKEMLINVLQPEECRIAIIEDGLLEELYVERTSHETYTGNIYKGRIVNLEPAIQAAFVDFSIGRNGFLHVSDIEPRYYRRQLGDDVELGGRDRGRDPRRTPRSENAPQGRSEFGRGDARQGGRGPRDNRRSGPPAVSSYSDYPPQSYATGPAETESPAGFGGGQANADFDDFGPLPTVAPPNPAGPARGDSRRERPRRGGQGRDRNRTPRSRDRSFRGGPRNDPEQRPAEFNQIPDADYMTELDLDSPLPNESEKPLDTTWEQPTHVPEVDVTFVNESPIEPEHISFIEPTAPETVYEMPVVIPPPQPSRSRRGFGAGLEDWDTESLPSGPRRPLTPVPPAIPIASESSDFGASAKPQHAAAEAVSEKPASSKSETSTVSRSMPPAATKPPARSRFGSGLLEEFEPVAQQAPTTEPVPELLPATEEEEVHVLLPEASVYSEQLILEDDTHHFRTSAEEPAAHARHDEPPFDVDEPTGFEPPRFESAVQESAEVFESFVETPELVAEQEVSSFESDVVESPAPRSRGRRKSGQDRSRSRGRKNSEESTNSIAPGVEPENGDLEPAQETASFSTEVRSQTVEILQVHPGRSAIRNRSGERPEIGPRPLVSEDFLRSELAQQSPPPSREKPAAAGGSASRYVPRLEREKRKSRHSGGPSKGAVNAEFGAGPEESDFDVQDLIDEAILTGQDPDAISLGDPRIHPDSQQNKNRRRRRRRRPGVREGQSGLSEPQNLGDADAIGLEPGVADLGTSDSDWSELDWSGSPPGAAEALSDSGPMGDSDFESEPSSPSSSRGQRPRRGPKRQRRGRSWSEMGPAPGDELTDEMEDDLSDSSSGSYVLDPNDIVEPELEEEIRREAEEIEALEIELGIRQPGEFRESSRGGSATGRPAMGRGPYKPPIQDVFQRNDEVLVQVIKESLGTKGPTLSTYISIPGRYLVLMPGLNRVGVSRKIGDESQRRKLRDQMNQLNPPKGLGFIVRTAGVDRTKRDLARDLAYLLRLWKTILRRIKRTKSPAPIYQESDMIIRTIRDIFNAEIDTIWIDEPSAFERAQEFLRNVMPKFVDRLKLYSEKIPLFHKYGIEDEIAKIGQRHVPLPDGGSIVIDQTEALVAIDVNSGSFRADDDAERNAYEMNLRAAREIARQLRLRDLGGVIVNDFIDMRDERHRRGVERALRDAIRRDRARTKILHMSQFGLIEMTRQRIRPSIKRSIYEDCPNCLAQGVVKTPESMSIDVMRILALAVNRQDIRRINITCSQNVANFLNNRKRQDLARFERDGHLTIHIRPEPEAPAEFLQIDGFGNYNTEVRLYPTQAMISHRRLPNTTGNAPALPYGHSSSHSSSHGFHR